MTEMSNALRFMKLFKGYSQSHGTYNPSGLGGEGKQKPQYPTQIQFLDAPTTRDCADDDVFVAGLSCQEAAAEGNCSEMNHVDLFMFMRFVLIIL